MTTSGQVRPPTSIPTALTITEAKATVVYEPAVGRFFLDLLSGRTGADKVFVRGMSKPDHAQHADLYGWRGQIPGAVGDYGVASLYDAHALDLGDPALDNGTGLTASRVARLVSVFVEADDISMDDQAARLDHLEAHTGIRGLAILTGDTRPESIEAADVAPGRVKAGKSIHFHVPIVWIEPTDIEAVAKWKACGDMLAAIMMGDIRVAGDLARKSRVGGLVAGNPSTKVRVQTYIRRPGPALPIDDLYRRLRDYCDRFGIDVEGRLRALRVAREAKLSARSRERAVRAKEVPDSLTIEAAEEQAVLLRELHDAIIEAEAVTDEQDAFVKDHPRWVRRRTPPGSGPRPGGGGGGPGGRRFVYSVFDLNLATRIEDFASLVIPGSDDTLADRAERMTGRHAWVRCPVHSDRDASSKLWRGRDGVLRMRCYAGCGEIIDREMTANRATTVSASTNWWTTS